jgi:pSer/pThr/pTyr-binding forkhead associated (FHA) protein
VAMILEVLHPGGARSWHRLGDFPLTVGRSLTNDLVLDDPYVDARHARIALNESGDALIEDLGSVNGLVVSDVRLQGRVPVHAGAEIRVGHTTLRFRDPEEPVSPALLDEVAAVVTPAPPAIITEPSRAASSRGRVAAAAARLAAMTWTRLLVAAVAVLGIAAYRWMGSADRSSTSEAFFAALAFSSTIALWAGIWAVASRVSVQRFHFIGHVAVVSVVALGGLVWAVLAEWASFFFPDASLADVMSAVVGLLLLSALVAGHLSFASTMPRKRQWRAGFIVAGTALVIAGLAALAEEDSFTDVPTFSGVVKPIASGWLPTATVEEFSGVMVNLKEQVDEMAKKQGR